jgi:hypothetical protein
MEPLAQTQCQVVVMESQSHRMWKQFLSHITSHSPRRWLRVRFQPADFIGLQAGGEARAGLNPEPLNPRSPPYFKEFRSFTTNKA